MKKFNITIYVVLFVLGATALWYFGYHRSAQQILNAEPKKVYESVPIRTLRTTEDSHAHPRSYTPKMIAWVLLKHKREHRGQPNRKPTRKL